MARISKTPPPGHWKLKDRKGVTRCADVDQKGDITFTEQNCQDGKAHRKREEDSFQAIPADHLWKTQVADSYAYYYVRSQTPSIFLSHIPYGDGWHANPALIRGLRKNEILQDIRHQKVFREMFEEDQARKKALAESETQPQARK